MILIRNRGLFGVVILALFVDVALSQSCPPSPGKLQFSVRGGSTVYYALNATGIPTGSDQIPPATTITNAINA
jgi:hypothetical protein